MSGLLTIYKNASIQTKTMIAPVILVLLLILLVVITYIKLANVKANLVEITDDLAPETATAAQIMEGVYRKRLAVKNYIKTSSDQSKQQFDEAEQYLTNLFSMAAKTVKEPDQIKILQGLEAMDAKYNAAFHDIVVKNMDQRNELVNNVMNQHGPLIEQKLTEIMKSAYDDGDTEAAFYAGSTLRTMLLARLYAFKFLTDNDKASEQRATEELANTKRWITDLQSRLQNPERQKLAQETTASVETYQQAFAKVVTAIHARNDAINNVLDKNGPMIATDTVKLRDAVLAAMSNEGMLAEEHMDDMRSLVITVSVISALIGLFFSYIVSMGIKNPILQTNASLKDIAQGDGDLTKRIPVNSSDEIGQLGKNFNQFVSKLQTLIGEIASATDQLSTAAEEMSVVTRDTNKTISSQKHETIQVASAINEMTAAVRDVANNAESASKAASDGDREAKAGALVIQDTVAAIRGLSQEIEQSSSVIQTLKTDSEGIGTVLDVIKSIAEQTNLLALNAAIEAARAGDQGRGFAVVADEVRTLAQKTQDSTNEIENLIAALQTGADRAVQTMERNSDGIRQLVTKAETANGSLHAITSAVESISEMNILIATSAEQQSNVVDEINQNIHNIQELSESTATGSEQISVASHQLAELGTRLQKLVDQFKIV